MQISGIARRWRGPCVATLWPVKCSGVDCFWLAENRLPSKSTRGHREIGISVRMIWQRASLRAPGSDPGQAVANPPRRQR